MFDKVIDRKRLKTLLKRGKSEGIKWFATVGKAFSATSLPIKRGEIIKKQMAAIKRSPPVFGAIVVHEKKLMISCGMFGVV